MVEAAPSCAILGGFAIGARVALLWQHNANPSYKLASIPRYDDIVQKAGWAGSACAAGRWLAGEGGVVNITAAAWTAGFLWWRSGNKKRTQNVSEYMLVLALCLVTSCGIIQLHRVSKNVPPLACYNFDTHEWILIFFGRNVTDKVGNQKDALLCHLN